MDESQRDAGSAGGRSRTAESQRDSTSACDASGETCGGGERTDESQREAAGLSSAQTAESLRDAGSAGGASGESRG
eukprot:15464755-Alexandrium_andersonii.AAC.1